MLETLEETNKRGGVGIRGRRKNALTAKIIRYEALYVQKSGVYGRENASSTQILLTDKKICSNPLFGTLFKKFVRKD